MGQKNQKNKRGILDNLQVIKIGKHKKYRGDGNKQNSNKTKEPVTNPVQKSQKYVQ
jgi:hypothetical protein